MIGQLYFIAKKVNLCCSLNLTSGSYDCDHIRPKNIII